MHLAVLHVQTFFYFTFYTSTTCNNRPLCRLWALLIFSIFLLHNRFRRSQTFRKSWINSTDEHLIHGLRYNTIQILLKALSQFTTVIDSTNSTILNFVLLSECGISGNSSLPMMMSSWLGVTSGFLRFPTATNHDEQTRYISLPLVRTVFHALVPIMGV